jgi:hypothetical protein
MDYKLVARLEALERSNKALQQKISNLSDFVYIDHFFNRLFEKAFQVMCFGGDYVEFGVYKGDSLVQAYQAAERIFSRLNSEYWDAGFVDKSRKKLFRDAWDKMRFIGFDTFSGMPELNKVDATYDMFEEGSFCTTIEKCKENLSASGVDLGKVELVKGNFEDSLNQNTALALQLSNLSVVHIDCDLYS